MISVYPTGTTIYKPDKCWSGYTILSGHPGATLIDMNGNVVKKWEGMDTMPNRVLPGGYLVTSQHHYEGGHQESEDLTQLDWDGKVVWSFRKFEEVPVQGGPPPGNPPPSPSKKMWVARQHHDWQREGNPVGYYAPGMEPMVKNGKTLIIGHTAARNTKINKKVLMDDVVYEVTWDGKVIWNWLASEHVDEMGFSKAEFDAMQRAGRGPRPFVDWFHMNDAAWLGPNTWYDAGDERFHPDNVIFCSRHTAIMAIIDKRTDRIVWQIGPDFNKSPQLKKLGWMIGVHHAHMIPKGLPGAGNIMVYDNGGSGGYGPPNPVGGPWAYCRDYSRVLEFHPVTLEKVWEYSSKVLGLFFNDSMREYSPYISSAQRLPNGNTLITEGAMGRLIEVPPNLEVVWEYVSPYYKLPPDSPPDQPPPKVQNQMIYRAYRVPYEWVPQLKKPKEKAVIPPRNKDFKVEGSGMNFRIKLK